MTFKQKTIYTYFGIALLFSLYGWLFGPYSGRGFFYNLGKGIVWPVTIFPALGAVVGGIIMIAVIAVLVFGNGRNR
jgi:hypothetical protein